MSPFGRVSKRNFDEMNGNTSSGIASRQSQVPTPSPIVKDEYGLIELSSREGEKTLDIVAVHGLQGHAFKTWEHENGQNWLKEFLPKDLPSARIFTFGYESAVVSDSAAIITDKSRSLLNNLALKHRTINAKVPRPILFICHSLGGIIVKKALNIAHNDSSRRGFKDVLGNTRAIAFLGVPRKYFGTFIPDFGRVMPALLRKSEIHYTLQTYAAAS